MNTPRGRDFQFRDALCLGTGALDDDQRVLTRPDDGEPSKLEEWGFTSEVFFEDVFRAIGTGKRITTEWH